MRERLDERRFEERSVREVNFVASTPEPLGSVLDGWLWEKLVNDMF